MSVNKLKEIAQKQNVKASNQALKIMRSEGCSSCCSFSDGGNSQQIK